MSQLVRLEGKQTTQTAHCAVLPPRPRSNFKNLLCSGTRNITLEKLKKLVKITQKLQI